MKPRYVIDTNVLITASAAHIGNAELQDVTPNDQNLCQKVLDWLIAFEQSDSVWLVDTEGAIEAEYRGSRFLNPQSYGMMLFQHKLQNCQADWVPVQLDQNGKAVLISGLQQLIHDTSDRIMVATAYGKALESGDETIANASDTDWYAWVDGLKDRGIHVEQIIPEWSYPKYLQKEGKKT